MLEGLPILYSPHHCPPFLPFGLILNSVGHRSVLFSQKKYISVVLWTSNDLLGLLIIAASVYHFGPDYFWDERSNRTILVSLCFVQKLNSF